MPETAQKCKFITGRDCAGAWSGLDKAEVGWSGRAKVVLGKLGKINAALVWSGRMTRTFVFSLIALGVVLQGVFGATA